MEIGRIGSNIKQARKVGNSIDREFMVESFATQGVYIVTTYDDWPCKIGISGNMSERMIGLQNGNWHRLRPHYFAFPHKSNLGGNRMKGFNAIRRAASAFEAVMHRRLGELVDRLEGEWFDISADDALLAMKKIAEEEGFKLAEFDMVLKLNPRDVMFDDERAALHDMLLVAGTAEAAIMAAKARQLTG